MAESKSIPALSVGDGRNGPGRAAPQAADKAAISMEPAPDGIIASALRGIQISTPAGEIDREAG